MHDHVTVETDGGVEWIRFDRAEHANAFTEEMFEMAADALSVVNMGGDGIESQATRATEVSVRGFWRAYWRHMGY